MILVNEKKLSNAGIINNPRAAEGEGLGRKRSDGKGTRTSIKHHAIHFDRGRNSNVPVTRDAKAGISDAPFGTVAGVELLAVFQSELDGCAFQVALPAKAPGEIANARIKTRLSLVFMIHFQFSALGFSFLPRTSAFLTARPSV